jgi:ribonuclease T1
MRLVRDWFFFVAHGLWQLLGDSTRLRGRVGLLALAALVAASQPAGATALVNLSELPPEAQQTYRLIHAGGPFPYPKDGVVFGNRERQLPSQVRGYYREYTVKTPRSRDRGARRIVCGGREPAAPEVCFYTQDHYASFRRISP